jgi:hypothetical protein
MIITNADDRYLSSQQSVPFASANGNMQAAAVVFYHHSLTRMVLTRIRKSEYEMALRFSPRSGGLNLARPFKAGLWWHINPRRVSDG